MNAPRHTDLTTWVEANQAYLSAEFARLKACIEREDVPESTPAIHPPAAIDRLAVSFGLSDFERDLILLLAGIALEPALAAAWGAQFGQRCVSFEQAMAALPEPHWSATVPSEPLRHWRLLAPDTAEALTVAPLYLDERILHYVAGIDETVGPVGVAEQPGQRVEHHRRAGVANVGAAVNGGAADIHGDAVGVGGDELALLARHGVVEADHLALAGCPAP